MTYSLDSRQLSYFGYVILCGFMFVIFEEKKYL